MARSYYGHDRKRGRVAGRRNSWPAACLISILPLLAACDSLVDAAGFGNGSWQETVSVAPAPQPSKKRNADPAYSARVSETQGVLNDLEYDAGPTDGIMGPRTEAAIRHFQADADLPVDGNVSSNLSAALLREYDLRKGVADAAEPTATTRTSTALVTKPGGQDERDAFDGKAGRRIATIGLAENPVPTDRQKWAAGTAAATAVPPKSWPGRNDSVAPEPYYEIGDNYIYSNGRIETAVRIEGSLVHWVANDGSRYLASSNFVMPPVKWENGDGAVESTVVSSSSVTWPPARIDDVVYTAKPVELNAGRRLHEAWSGEWRCGAGEWSTLAVPAGKFDVVKITCEKTSRAPGEWRRRVWYYAPDLRHFVRKEETVDIGRSPTVMELIAIHPDRSSWTSPARSGFNWAIQKLLDRGTVGDSFEWTVADSGIEFDIVLTGEMRTADSSSCRRYVVVRKKPGNPRILPALACRDGVSGRWKIPGLEKGSIMPTEELASR